MCLHLKLKKNIGKYMYLIGHLSYITHDKNTQTRANVAAYPQRLRADRNQQRCPSNTALSAAASLSLHDTERLPRHVCDMMHARVGM